MKNNQMKNNEAVIIDESGITYKHGVPEIDLLPLYAENIIPAGFERDVLEWQNKPVQKIYEYNPDWRMLFITGFLLAFVLCDCLFLVFFADEILLLINKDIDSIMKLY